jgi:hypothetical protein
MCRAVLSPHRLCLTTPTSALAGRYHHQEHWHSCSRRSSSSISRDADCSSTDQVTLSSTNSQPAVQIAPASSSVQRVFGNKQDVGAQTVQTVLLLVLCHTVCLVSGCLPQHCAAQLVLTLVVVVLHSSCMCRKEGCSASQVSSVSVVRPCLLWCQARCGPTCCCWH